MATTKCTCDIIVFLCIHSTVLFTYYFLFHRIGAAISVESQIVPSVLSKLLFNPLCFLQYEHTTVAPGDWDDVSMTSSNV